MIDERQIRDMLLRRADTVPATPVDTHKAVRRARGRLLANGIVATVVVATIAVTAFTRVDATRSAPIPGDQPTKTPVSQAWSPVREGDLAVQQGHSWDDPLDASVGWIDVTHVKLGYSSSKRPLWSIKLAAKPPKAASLEPGELIAYGVVLETTGDGVADYLIGINNDAPEQGDFHVWVTDLATGTTDEQIGPPYGYPIEFRHPDEAESPNMTFWFLGRGARGCEPQDGALVRVGVRKQGRRGLRLGLRSGRGLGDRAMTAWRAVGSDRSRTRHTRVSPSSRTGAVVVPPEPGNWWGTDESRQPAQSTSQRGAQTCTQRLHPAWTE